MYIPGYFDFLVHLVVLDVFVTVVIYFFTNEETFTFTTNTQLNCEGGGLNGVCVLVKQGGIT